MNRLQRPDFFDDHAALEALANNQRVKSYPQLQPHVAAIRAGYTQYVAANGDVSAIGNVPLPQPIAGFLKAHYLSPPNDIAYIDEIRAMGGVSTCPMCGSMHSGTLDHVLPRTGFPAFAIFGLNLVPACKCNSLRSTALVGPNPGERILHPYFDDVLEERILAAHFDDLGAVPHVSIRLLLDPAHPSYRAARFHIRNVVERTQVRDYLIKTWVKLIERPSRVAVELRHNPPSRDALVEVLTRELERFDEFHESRNNWNSVFMAGLLDEHVTDWLFEQFNLPGRASDSTLVP